MESATAAAHCAAPSPAADDVAPAAPGELAPVPVAGGEPAATSNGTPVEANLFDRLGRPVHVLAPMVDQSELPFRLLARRYGAQLCYTPMFNANVFNNSAAYRQEAIGRVVAEDRPLIVQFAGHDSAVLLQAARHVEHMCDAIDLNLGCPQGIARRGRYGAFLLEEEDLVVDIVRRLTSELTIPVTCKIRLFRDDFPRTLRLVRRLEDAGCALLTVHGRDRHQNKQTVGECDFEKIAAVKAALRIPVVANGGIATLEDVRRCRAVTGVDGVMSSEAALENPALFCGNVDSAGVHIDQNRLAREYLDLAEQNLKSTDSSTPKCVKAHMFKFLFAGLQDHTDVRDRLGKAKTFKEFRSVVEDLTARGWQQPGFHREGAYLRHRSWYYRYRMAEACAADGVGLPQPAKKGGKRKKRTEVDDDGDDADAADAAVACPEGTSPDAQGGARAKRREAAVAATLPPAAGAPAGFGRVDGVTTEVSACDGCDSAPRPVPACLAVPASDDALPAPALGSPPKAADGGADGVGTAAADVGGG